jgi:hypothetical protein
MVNYLQSNKQGPHDASLASDPSQELQKVLDKEYMYDFQIIQKLLTLGMIK